jgi:hypothetical protein
MAGVAVKPLTVGFHETPFLSKLNQENKLGFWFQLDDRARQRAGSPWGPSDPQNLNRYSYALNNPLKYTDPTGHMGMSVDYFWGATQTTLHLTHQEATALWDFVQANAVSITLIATGIASKGVAVMAEVLSAQGFGGAVLGQMLLALSAAGLSAGMIATIAAEVALSMLAIDYLYGQKGFDIIFDPRMGIPIIAPPTVERQLGYWYFGEKFCNNLIDCTVKATPAPPTPSP